jgi:uncharacterized protein YndB with AHSA1/START domain
MTTETELVVRRTVDVNVTPERAFELFTADVARWWPVATHSIDDGTPVFEERVGGRLYERKGDAEHFWGKIVAWDPPHRLALEWKVNPEATAATDVEVTFTPDGDGTRVELVHTGFERLGAKAQDEVAGYGAGWIVVLGKYVEHASA